MREISHEQWIRDGVELYGKDFNAWAFKCPVCGNIATIKDFVNLRFDVSRNGAYRECIGRHTGGRPAMSDQGGRPCDYAAYGLIDLCTTRVVAPNGEIISVFEFADPGEERI